MTTTLHRRSLLAGSAGLLAGAGPPPAPFPTGATLLVGGPGGCATDQWAEWLVPGLARALPPGTALRKDTVGGADGVTAANQFEALAVPDGGTALLLPGTAALAALVGDPRARFDAAHWVPALAGVTPGLVVSRVALGGAAPLRIAAATPAGPDLPALLAMDLLRADWTPVFGLADLAAVEALAQGHVDAICLRGRHVAETLARLNGTAQPVFGFGTVDETGVRVRDPTLPDLPTVTELAGPAATAPLGLAWAATAAASELDVTMVLRQLTPAAVVSVWRRAVAQAATGAVEREAAATGVRTLPAPAAVSATEAVLADAAGQTALRDWMARRLDWRPG